MEEKLTEEIQGNHHTEASAPTTSVKKNFKQSLLRFTSQEVEGALAKSTLETTSIEYNPNCRKWMETLLPFFEIVQVSAGTGRSTKYTMRCLLCPMALDKPHQHSILTDKCANSFTRHLERHHKEQYIVYLDSKSKKGALIEEKDLHQQMISQSLQVQPYMRSDPRQKRFEKDLKKMIIVDMLPLTFASMPGFQNLVHGFDKRINFPCNVTLKRWITDEFEKTKDKIRKDLRELPEGSLHLITDIWTSQQGQSILGLKGQYIKAWTVKQLVIGFKHFPEAHSSENIKKTINSFLCNEMKILPNQVASVTVDNAANMIGAFKQETTTFGSPSTCHSEASKAVNPQILPDADALDYISHSDGIDSDVENVMQAAFKVLDFSSEIDETEEVFTALDKWSNVKLTRNACLAHLLQLVVKDAINKCVTMVSLTKKINCIVTFFNNSPKWSAILKSKTSGLCLVKPVVTRWNSLYYCLKRITRKDDHVNVSKAINDTLTEAKTSIPKLSKIPAPFYDEDIEAATAAVELLEPFSELTDKFQAGGVTSSIVILGLINAVRDLTDVLIDSNIQNYDQIVSLKAALLEGSKTRFANLATVDYQVLSKKRKLVTLDVFHDPNYIVSSILDSRIKTSCFNESLTEGTILEGCVPGISTAVQVFHDCYKKERQIVPSSTGIAMEIDSREESEKSEPMKKKAKGMFHRLSELNSTSLISKKSEDEIVDYLALQMDSGENTDKISPLKFWQSNELRFPGLASMAQKYLGMPASSGSVERLFSVAAGLGKARNARLLPETTEMLLCCKFYS